MKLRLTHPNYQWIPQSDIYHATSSLTPLYFFSTPFSSLIFLSTLHNMLFPSSLQFSGLSLSAHSFFSPVGGGYMEGMWPEPWRKIWIFLQSWAPRAWKASSTPHAFAPQAENWDSTMGTIPIVKYLRTINLADKTVIYKERMRLPHGHFWSRELYVFIMFLYVSLIFEDYWGKGLQDLKEKDVLFCFRKRNEAKFSSS